MLFPAFGFLFILLLLGLFLGISFIITFLQALFLSGKRRGAGKSVREKWTTAGGDNAASAGQHKTAGRKKLFAPDEGEYVDFEEIKEEQQQAEA